MRYKDKIIKIERDFIDTLRNDIGEDFFKNKNIDKNKLNNKIRRCLYDFIFRNVSEKIGDKKDINYSWELFYKTIDFTLDFGFVFMRVLSGLNDYVEMDLEIDRKGEVDA